MNTDDEPTSACDGCNASMTGPALKGPRYELCAECARLAGDLFALWARIENASEETLGALSQVGRLKSVGYKLHSERALRNALRETMAASGSVLHLARMMAQSSSENGERGHR